MNPIKKALFIFLGMLSLFLGILGIFLPVLPTTPFLILSAYLFARSSKKLHRWLLSSRWFGKYIHDYKSRKGISIKNKFIIYCTLWGVILYSMMFGPDNLWIRLFLLAVAISVTIYMRRIRTLDKRRDRFRVYELVGIVFGLYVTVHLLEEWLRGFPGWAEDRWGLPGYDTTKWLMHNIYFVVFLLAGFIAYRCKGNRILFLGLGIGVWALMNSLSQLVFTFIFMEYSPGLLTGLIMAMFSILAFRIAWKKGMVDIRTGLLSLVTGLIYWGAPILLFIEIDMLLGL